MEITVGIFWVIRGKIYSKKQQKETEAEKTKKRVESTGKIDSDFGHFETWDTLCAREYPSADFATYPRGRVLFDLKKQEYILYVDECVSDEETEKIVALFKLSKYRIERDEHYACDKCINKKTRLL